MSDGRLQGRRLLVTGGASGIGQATALRFVHEGAAVVVVDRAAPRADDPAVAAGVRSLCADVSDAAAVERVVREAASLLGGIDGVVNAAGVTVDAALADTTDALWSKAIAINLTGPFLVCRAALPLLRRAPGVATIVNIASAVGLHPLPNRAAYAASKGGLVALSKALAIELAPVVRVNALLPGAVDTPMVRDRFGDAARDALAARYALGRLGRADELADAVLYLTSGESSFVTGASLVVDGGRIFH